MAGDWIKMRMDLPEDPAVYRIARITGLDRLAVVGRLYAFWSWADKHAVDGRVDGGSSADVDDIVHHSGFADAMVKVNWLEVGDEFLAIPKHDRHNGESAKERSLKNARQARWREGRGDASSSDASTAPPTDASTREEKRREEKKKAPKGAVDVPDWIPAKPWEDFVAMRRAKGSRTPFTLGAAKGIIAKLEGFRDAGHDLAEILRQSTISGWADVFEPRAKQGGKGGDDWTGTAK